MLQPSTNDMEGSALNNKLVNDEEVIRHLKEIHSDADTSNFKVLDFASAFGSPMDALVYSKLFWPDFFEFENMIFLSTILESEDDRSRVRAAISKGASKAEIEKSFNTFDISSDFFASCRASMTEAEEDTLAERMAEMWRARLKQLFPTRDFDVEVAYPPDELPNITVSRREAV